MISIILNFEFNIDIRYGKQCVYNWLNIKHFKEIKEKIMILTSVYTELKVIL